MTEDGRRTPLDAVHRSRGARMVPFAGYEMPLNFPAGILREHLHTREAASLFDVSHMGQVEIRAKSGDVADAAAALERLVPMDVAGLRQGRQRYAFLTDAEGGIFDDLMIARCGDHLFLVVNAARKAADLAYLREALAESCEVSAPDRALLALQGPKAEAVLATLDADVAQMRFMDVRNVTLGGVRATVSRSGYSGEDGYEIALPEEAAADVAARLLDDPAVMPAGLGARDSLRLEAGLCLYGQDIDSTTTPVEAALEWAIQPVRRPGGARSGGFPGAEVILGQIAQGAARRRVGLRPEGRAPMREGTKLFAGDGGEAVGEITSGGFGPSLAAPVAMGYVPAELAAPGTQLLAELRGRRLPVTVARLPFIEPRYKRG
jgi:aminomethyltransferase